MKWETYRHDFRNTKWYISYRASKWSLIDLSIITTTFGGGGHPKASGFTISDTFKTISLRISNHSYQIFLYITIITVFIILEEYVSITECGICIIFKMLS